MPTQNVDITDKITNFLQDQVKSGNFKNESEVHRAALVAMARREDERQVILSWLKSEARVGLDRIEAGAASSFQTKEALDSWMDEVLTEVISKTRSVATADQDTEPVTQMANFLLVLSDQAKREVASILEWSNREFGPDAALR